MSKYQVHWVHEQLGKDETHGEFDTHEQALQSIHDWWNKNDYKPVYVRMWTRNGVSTIDYGFHHMFYKIVEIKENEPSMTMKPTVYFTLDNGAQAPKRGRELDFAVDLHILQDTFILPNRLGATIVPTGLHTAFDSEKYGLFLSPRSGITKYPLALANSTGIIEGEYRGDIGIPLRNVVDFSYSPQSNQVLFVGDNGKLQSTKVSKFMKRTSARYKLYEKELDKLEQDYALLFGKERAKDWAKAIRENDLNGDMVVPTGTLFLPKGMRLAQAYLVDRKDTLWEQVDRLSETTRGENGYGSSGAF